MNIRKFFIFFSLLIPILFVAACSEDTSEEVTVLDPNADANINSCEGCHTNYDVLKEIYTPDPPSTGGHGCGGDAPHYEPYDRVYLSGTGYQEFKDDIHGKLGCVSCHNGTDHTADKELAHSGDFISQPSLQSEDKCGSCHPDIWQRTHNSLHEQGLGQKAMVAGRSGVDSFDQLTEAMKDGYEDNCATCHASCGDCHVNRPPAGGGGLYDGHNFQKTPNMRDHCTTCHVSRGGHAYFGIAPGTVPDAHLTEAGFTCMNCHSQDEVHGDGEIYDQRYKMKLLPGCDDCHTDIEDDNLYHSTHIETFNCQACHSQVYNNCGSCHIGAEGARIPSYNGFKIGMNPIPETKPYKYALLRRSLMAPDSWDNYGTQLLPNFDFAPTFKYTTPHNILRWTERTQVEEGKACFDACHIIVEGDTVRNKELYLFESDLLEWEKTADEGIIVDGHLPSGWE